MVIKLKKLPLLICFSFAVIFCCIAQSQEIKLLRWSAADCDHTFNPDRLKERITSIESNDSLTILTVNFPDNCCATFKPTVAFQNGKLFLLPYEKYQGDYCTCDCCFSIVYTISGLKENKYKVYFKGKKVELSDNHYETFAPTFKIYKGTKINRTNKYMFKEGLWVTFYNTGQEETITQYPESSLYNEPEEIWSKGFYNSGKLSYYNRKDTSQEFYEEGDLKHLFITYRHGDTIYEEYLNRYDNKLLEKNSLEKHYPTVFTSEFNPDYRGEGTRWETVYEEQYYPNKKPKYRYGSDTSYKWSENGNIKLKRYPKGKLEFNEQGQLTERAFFWNEKAPEGWADLSYALYVEFYPSKRTVKEIEFTRDESDADGNSMAPNVHYRWVWDAEGKLTQSPNNWTEQLPWKKFKEIVVQN